MSNPVLANRYEVQQQLGQKPGCRTLLARDRQADRPVVIKLITLEQEMEWDDMKLFEREVQTLMQLSHPAIPQYVDYFEVPLRTGKGYALVQTHLVGASLESHLQRGTSFISEDLLHIGRSVLEILAYLHNQDPVVIHRDIKPSNIILGPKQAAALPSVYLIDFGSVRTTLESSASSFTVVGTYGYMPPEQFSGRAVMASDLYSLGATLIAIAAGAHPSSLPHRNRQFDLEQIPQLPEELRPWLQQMVAVRLEQRFKSAEQALAALDQVGVKIPQPPTSRIILEREGDRLEVTIPGLSGTVRLKLDRQRASLASELLGLPLTQQTPIVTSGIDRLDCLHSHDKDASQRPGIRIWAGQNKLELGPEIGLSDSEVAWLGYELSSWLNIPVTPG